MSTFALVTIVVCCASAVIAAYLFFKTAPALDGLGRGGWLWMDHEQDLPLEDQPSEDDPDLPLPKRTLRGRFE